MMRTYDNIVSSYFYYMWNYWGTPEECRQVFGEMSSHFWEKWVSLFKSYSSGAAERFYAELSDDNRRKLVERACQIYDGNDLAKEPSDDKIVVCDVCGYQHVQQQVWCDANTHEYIGETECDKDDNWCDECEEHYQFCTRQEFKVRMQEWWNALDAREQKQLSDNAEDCDAWWTEQNYEQQREIYNDNKSEDDE